MRTFLLILSSIVVGLDLYGGAVALLPSLPTSFGLTLALGIGYGCAHALSSTLFASPSSPDA